MEGTRPSAPVVIHRRLNQSNRLEITQTVCTLFAAIIFLSSMLSVLASFHVGYGIIRTELVQLYGEDRTSRYFTPIVFHSFVSRVQFGSGVIGVLAIVMAAFRRRLSCHLESFWGALKFSARHERRSHAKWNLASGISLGSIAVIGFLLRLYFVNQPMRVSQFRFRPSTPILLVAPDGRSPGYSHAQTTRTERRI